MATDMPGFPALPVSAERDPYFGSVVSLIGFNHAHGSQTIEDAISGKKWVDGGHFNYNDPVMVGDACGYFSAANISHAVHADFGFGDGMFTVEGFMTHDTGTGNQCIVDTRNASIEGFALYASTGAHGGQFVYTNNAAELAWGGNSGIIGCRHWAVTRDEVKTVRVFAGGALLFSLTDSRTFGSAAQVVYGANYVGTQQLVGAFLDELRITKGVCRYRAAFVQPRGAFPRQ